MNGRFFGGNQLEVMLYDGLIKYQKSKNTNSTLDEDDQEVAEQQRLEDYARWLENEKSTKDESLS
ncbi:hypothetical protein NADFUDRAFT_84284 [Nadsonia fulvescens var. elongata DSM 6958]|uniref:Uncharacterized protein n=1 Tax=Nadsonia fulvescens var. elongata DSM 6958 TaxID=857566 RepID=A0A1E3PEC2_9ASCO|nr:hypothetical protein NADFUDRAFT_84284 [Nadsonia fulvescens var. elongata DSM 6958]